MIVSSGKNDELYSMLPFKVRVPRCRLQNILAKLNFTSLLFEIILTFVCLVF